MTDTNVIQTFRRLVRDGRANAQIDPWTVTDVWWKADSDKTSRVIRDAKTDLQLNLMSHLSEGSPASSQSVWTVTEDGSGITVSVLKP